MNTIRDGDVRFWKFGFGLVRTIIVAGLLFCAARVFAQLSPYDDLLDSWSFNDTTWVSDFGYLPGSFTNLDNPTNWDGNALEVNSSNVAWLSYPIINYDDTTNLDFGTGSIEFWIKPDWDSANLGGTGPVDWGRLIEVGTYTTNAAGSWWSLYLTGDGNNLLFSSQTNGATTNYLDLPISWDSNTWHFITLTYSPSQSQLYLDGQLATNGPGVIYLPGPAVATNDFFVGSDTTGTAQMRAQMDDLATYNYVLDASAVAYDFDTGLQVMSGTTPTNQNPYPNGTGVSIGTNLALTVTGVANGLISLEVTNSSQDVTYEIQGSTNLALGESGWFSLGFVGGSELTNWTAASVPLEKTGNLFVRIRSWQDSTGTQIPDWWWLEFFGQITNVNAYASAANDGFDNLYKFQNNLNPTNYYNPNPVPDFFGCLDATGTNVILEWSNAPGPVIGYALARGNYISGDFTTLGTVSSNADFFDDVGANTNNNATYYYYTIVALYPGDASTPTNTWYWTYGSPTPDNVYAYVDATGTNVLFSWTPVEGATNYLIERGVYNATNYDYDFSPVGQTGGNATNYEVMDALTNANNWGDEYGLVAVFSGGGLSQLVPSNFGLPAIGISPVNVGATNGPAVLTNFYGYSDPAGNIYLNWNAASGNVTNYLIYGGNDNPDSSYEIYSPLGTVNAGTTNFEVTGNPYSLYSVVAAYSDTNLSQAATWDATSGTSGPGALVAYVDWTGTNIMLAWSPVVGATGYVIEKSTDSGADYYQIGTVGSGTTTTFEDTGGNSGDLSGIMYEVQATFPNGGSSSAVSTGVTTDPPAPSNLSVSVSGANAVLTWTPVLTPGVTYTIERGVYNPDDGTYSYTQVGQVSTASFTDTGAITGNSSYNNAYEVIANYPGSQTSIPIMTLVSSTATPPAETNMANFSVTANLIRNETGHWELVFSGLSTNIQAIALYWYQLDNFYYLYGAYYDNAGDIATTKEDDIPVSQITNGIYVLPDYQMTNWFPNNWIAKVAMVQPIDINGQYGQLVQAGFQPYDSPEFVDGRQFLMQNLLYQLRSAGISQPNAPLSEIYWNNPFFYNLLVSQDFTNYVESSIFHWSGQENDWSGNVPVPYVEMDDLWPITANYQLHQNLYDPNYNGPSSFVWQPDTGDEYSGPDLAFQESTLTITNQPVLGIGDPYWISQGLGNLAQYAAHTNSGSLYLENGVDNLFGLAFEQALVNNGSPIVTLNPGNSVGMGNVNSFYSQTADPVLQLDNYYFAPVNTPGTALSDGVTPSQPYPLPCLTGFDNSDQTGVMIASVGTPTVIGGWGKFSIQNSSKFAYLGEYFGTNAYVMDANGNITTNTTGVVSPYGDFFPTQPGDVAMITMPDYNNDLQGTGVVHTIEIETDRNHDGTMDPSYFGPDFTSTNRPLRYWVNDDQDWGDYGGNGGIPGAKDADGTTPVGVQYTGFLESSYQYLWGIHGRRDLVDFFPVYLNIGSLFQSNALSAGINYADTNWQFVLSQADGALRFAYTDLTPTNYMNYLRNVNESGELAYWSGNQNNYAPLTTVSNSADGGAPLSPSFIAGIATNNEGIILVEAWTNTTQPLVLTIYHGTNQIAQTSLYLSISGVEQMFRSKTILLHSDSHAVPDRLTDASVPNEPETTDKNFVFVHGYNVNPQEARGVAADVFKRMYWSGSHAKFWAVTWEGYDTQGSIPGLSDVTPDYQSNVFNAFLTAPLLVNFIDTLTNTGPVVVAAHSLGNMVVLDALDEYSAPISQYFMLDAAVPLEAIEGIGNNLSLYMTHSTWTDGATNLWGTGYPTNVWASYWYKLFPTNDYRSTLTWDDRLANLQNADVYNFYSSGEEVLRTYTTRPTPSFVGTLENLLSQSFWHGAPLRTYVWNLQELGKGTTPFNTILGSDHGGWGFNTAYTTNNLDGSETYISPAAAAQLSTATLQTNPVFDVTYDTPLFGSDGSSYAQTNRNRILSDAIPALTLPIGANPASILNQPGQLHNFDMMELENGWPEGRLTSGEHNNDWYHSDFHQVAYTFTYQLFDQMVTLGNLK